MDQPQTCDDFTGFSGGVYHLCVVAEVWKVWISFSANSIFGLDVFSLDLKCPKHEFTLIELFKLVMFVLIPL